MIIEGLLSGLLAVVQAVVGLLPEAGELGLDGFGQAVSAFGAFDAGLPVHETLAMAGMCLSIIGGIFATRLVLTIWHAIPGKFS